MEASVGISFKKFARTSDYTVQVTFLECPFVGSIASYYSQAFAFGGITIVRIHSPFMDLNSLTFEEVVRTVEPSSYSVDVIRKAFTDFQFDSSGIYCNLFCMKSCCWSTFSMSSFRSSLSSSFHIFSIFYCRGVWRTQCRCFVSKGWLSSQPWPSLCLWKQLVQCFLSWFHSWQNYNCNISSILCCYKMYICHIPIQLM